MLRLSFQRFFGLPKLRIPCGRLSLAIFVRRLSSILSTWASHSLLRMLVHWIIYSIIIYYILYIIYTLELLMMGIVLPETCWASNKICNKYHLLHLVGILFPHNRDVCFKLAMFCNICLLYDNVVTFYTYDILDVSRVTVWLTGLIE